MIDDISKEKTTEGTREEANIETRRPSPKAGKIRRGGIVERLSEVPPHPFTEARVDYDAEEERTWRRLQRKKRGAGVTVVDEKEAPTERSQIREGEEPRGQVDAGKDILDSGLSEENYQEPTELEEPTETEEKEEPKAPEFSNLWETLQEIKAKSALS